MKRHGIGRGRLLQLLRDGETQDTSAAGHRNRSIPDGSLNCAHKAVESAIALEAWTHKEACQHEDCILVHHYIGNVALVAFLRETLEKCADKFPIILSKVVYNGIHAGDYLTLHEVRAVRDELQHLPRAASDNAEDQQYLDRFRDQMTELVDCALELQKPIAF